MKPSKKENTLRLVLLAISFVVFLSGVFNILSRPTIHSSPSESLPPDTSPSLSVSSSSAASSPSEAYSVTLGAGIYTGGIDLPVGSYDLTLVEGDGNVYSSNFYTGGISETFAEGKTKTFHNALIEKNVTLTISGSVTVALTSENAAVSTLSPRTETEDVYLLSQGNYIAGKDFPVGTYTVCLTDGNGLLYSQNMPNGGLKETFGEKGITEFKNADFTQEGTLLSLSGISVSLTKLE